MSIMDELRKMMPKPLAEKLAHVTAVKTLRDVAFTSDEIEAHLSTCVTQLVAALEAEERCQELREYEKLIGAIDHPWAWRQTRDIVAQRVGVKEEMTQQLRCLNLLHQAYPEAQVSGLKLTASQKTTLRNMVSDMTQEDSALYGPLEKLVNSLVGKPETGWEGQS